MGLEKVEVAQAVRDAIRQIARDAVADTVSAPRFGRVISIDFVSLTASVWFPGDEKPVKVKFFSSTIPGDWQERYSYGSVNNSYSGYGSMASVVTLNGTQYITGVLNGGQFSVDWSAGGYIDMMYNSNGEPFEAGSGNYLYKPQWSQPYPNTNGGPYAINIGPFLATQSEPAANGNHEIEIINSGGKSQKYDFSLNPYYQMARNNTGSTQDRWFRVIPDKVNEDNSSNNSARRVNTTSQFSVADGVGDWIASSGSVVTADNSQTHSGAGSLRLNSTIGAAVTIGTETSTRYPVLPGATYTCKFWVMSPQGGWSSIDARVDWYNSSNVFISTSDLPDGSTVGTAWASYAQVATAPAGAAFASFRITVSGTPISTRFFHFDEVVFETLNAITKTDFSLDVCLRKTVHGSFDTDPANSYGEMWVRIYLHWLDAVTNTTFVVRVKNTGSWSGAKSTKTGKPVYEYVTSPTDAVGYLGYHDSGTPYTTNNSQIETNTFPGFGREVSTGPWRNPDLLLRSRTQPSLLTLGEFTWSGSALLWTGSIVVSGVGRSRQGLSIGSATLDCPTSGTIPVLPSGTAVTATATGIPLAAGQSLWFGIPPGLTSGTIPAQTYFNGGLHGVAGLFIVDSTLAEWWSPPEWAVLLAVRSTSGSKIRLGNGQTLAQVEYPNNAVYKFTAGAQTTTSTSNIDLTGASTTLFQKKRDDTSILVGLDTSNFVTGTNGSVVIFGVRIDSVDYDIVSNTFNVSSSHTRMHGVDKLTGIARGTKTIQIRMRVSAATMTLQVNNGSFFQLLAQECY